MVPRILRFFHRCLGCCCPCGLSFRIFEFFTCLCPFLCSRRNRNGCCCCGNAGNQVHPDIQENLEPVTDCTTLFAIQQFLDRTFRDRWYTGIYKPKFMTMVEAYRVRNDTAQRDYVAVTDKLQENNAERGSACKPFGDDILTGAECPLALRQDIERWGLDTPLDPTIHEHLFFHGTNEVAAKGIVDGDFRLPDTHEHGGMFGKGVYLGEASTKAHMYCKPRADGLFPIFICRSALGDVTVTVEQTPDPNALDRGAKQGEYNAVCGDRRKLKQNFSGYREFIVYDTGQVLAMYLLWCRESKVGPCCKRRCG